MSVNILKIINEIKWIFFKSKQAVKIKKVQELLNKSYFTTLKFFRNDPH